MIQSKILNDLLALSARLASNVHALLASSIGSNISLLGGTILSSLRSFWVDGSVKPTSSNLLVGVLLWLSIEFDSVSTRMTLSSPISELILWDIWENFTILHQQKKKSTFFWSIGLGDITRSICMKIVVIYFKKRFTTITSSFKRERQDSVLDRPTTFMKWNCFIKNVTPLGNPCFFFPASYCHQLVFLRKEIGYTNIHEVLTIASFISPLYLDHENCGQSITAFNKTFIKTLTTLRVNKKIT